MSWQYPKTEEEYVRLCKNFYQNVVKERIFEKEDSKYFKYVENMRCRCALCEIYTVFKRKDKRCYRKSCGKCFLPHGEGFGVCYLWKQWDYGYGLSSAKEIISLCNKRLEEIKSEAENE